MTALAEFLAAPFRYPWFLKALLGGGIVGLVCGVTGCLVVLRRMAFLGDALSHAMIAGVGAGYLLTKLVFGYKAHAGGMLLGAVIASIITVALINFVHRSSRIKEDTAIGIMYTFIFSVGLVLVTIFQDQIHIHIFHFLVGDVLSVTDDDLRAVAFFGAGVLTVLVLFFRQLQITSFDPVMAASLGISVALLDYLFTFCVSLVVVSGINMVGVILVVGLLITPAATAYLLTDRLRTMMVLAGLLALSSVCGGLYLSVLINSSGGGAIVLVCSLQFFLVLCLAPRYGLLAGWLRRLRRVPQELQEDLLRAVLKDGREAMPQSRLLELVQQTPGRIQRALSLLSREGLLELRGGQVALTPLGREYARKVMRAHRLWETYLDRLGLPKKELDARASKLEHILAEDAVDYLDHKLGHPLHDPHGAEIPEDFIHLQAGAPVPVSLLRPGQAGIVLEIRPAARYLALQLGALVRLQERGSDDNVWVLRCPDGSELSLDHAAADEVLVELKEGRAGTARSEALLGL